MPRKSSPKKRKSSPKNLSALASLLKSLNGTEDGPGAISLFGTGDDAPLETLPSGSLYLDRAMRTGGLPRGRIVEYYGAESTGKTTAAMAAIAEVQRNGGLAMLIDAEHSLEPKFAKALGVDLKTLLYQAPMCGEEALEAVGRLAKIKDSGVSLVVVDSVAALVPDEIIKKGDGRVAGQAALLSQHLRVLKSTIPSTGICLLMLNQLRSKFGGGGQNRGWGGGELTDTTGGRALKHYASIRVEFKRIKKLYEGGLWRVKKEDSDDESAGAYIYKEPIGIRVRARCEKNKLGPPFGQAEFSILFASGIDKIEEVFRMGLEVGALTQNGSWVAFDGKNIAQGGENAYTRLKEEPELLAAVWAEIVKRLTQGVPPDDIE